MLCSNLIELSHSSGKKYFWWSIILEAMATVNFCVFTTVKDGEFVGVVGSAPEIGNWKHDEAKHLEYNSQTAKWSKEIKFTTAEKIEYRFFVGAKVRGKNEEKVIVKKWEASVPKIVRSVDATNGGRVQTEDGEFGVINGKTAVDRGWLCGQTEVRFNISQPGPKPIISWRGIFAKYESKNLKIRFEPIESSSNVKVCLIKPFEYSELEHDQDVDLPEKDGNVLTFSTEVWKLASFYGRFVISDSDGEVLGHVNIVGEQLHDSIKRLTSAILDSNGKAIGSLQLEYMVIKTYPGRAMDMQQGYHVYWKKRPAIHIGHRGSGNSFTAETPSDFYENTISSFKKAALHSAAMIEFDVQLTKDKIPIVFHDFTICTSVKSKTVHRESLHEVPVNALTYDEMQNFMTRHRSRKHGKKDPVFEEDDTHPHLKPFPTLQEVFEEVPESVGFDVELKWPHYHEDQTWYHDVKEFGDENEFIDRILDVVFEYAGKRRVTFSCFEANICTLLRRKQNRYPVVFLTCGDYDTGIRFMDLRCRFNALAVPFAASEKFLGLCTLENDAYAVPDLVNKVHQAGLLYLLYGDNIFEKKNRDLLIKQGVDGLIYDRIHDVLPQGPNVYLEESKGQSSQS